MSIWCDGSPDEKDDVQCKMHGPFPSKWYRSHWSLNGTIEDDQYIRERRTACHRIQVQVVDIPQEPERTEDISIEKFEEKK